MMFGLPWAVPLGGSVIAQSSPGPPHRFSCEGLRGEKLDAESQDPSCVCCLGNAHPHVEAMIAYECLWEGVLLKRIGPRSCLNVQPWPQKAFCGPRIN